MGWMDEYNKALQKKRKENVEQIAVNTASGQNSSSWMNDYHTELNRLTSEEFAPISTVGTLSQEEDNRKWYEKGHFEDGYDFGDISKTILGISDKKELKTFEAPDTTDTLEELKQKRDYLNGRTWHSAEQTADALKYTQQYNQMALHQYADTLSKTKMDGQNHTVLEEIEILANMKSGKAKDKRKQAVLDKMESLGMDSSFYAHFAGDGEFDWKTFGEWAKNASLAGLNTFNKGLLDTADVLLGAPLKALGWENNPISEGAEYYNDLYSSYRYNANLLAEKLGGNAWNFGTDAVEGTLGALPNALLMFMTGGQSATASTTSLMNQAAMQTGNFLTKAGLTAETMMKNPQYWMSFARTLGSDYKEAKEMGASDLAATVGSVLKSTINSGIEIGLDGGSGVQGLGDALKDGGKPFWEWVESSLEEGGEEILQKFVGEVVNKVGYGSDEEILNPIEYAKEGTLGALSGMALGGGQTAVQSGVNAYAQHKANKLTDMEQSVMDKIVEKKIAQKEKDGKTLTTKEKADIEKEVERNLRKGYLSAEDIEEAIGGEVYESYKAEQDKFFASDAFQKYDKTKRDSQKRIEKLEKQLEEIGNQPNTVANSKKYDAIQNRIDILKKRTQSMHDSLLPEANRIIGIKEQMRSSMMGTVKDSRLAETYNELARSKQKFQVDVNQYKNENAKKTVQSILDSGLGDNSNQFHETVEWLAKLSEDRNVTFDLTKTERLKGTEHYKEGYVTNGFKTTEGGLTKITVNLDGNYLNTTVGHEITHVLEQAGNYEELSKAVREFAISKEGQEAYQKRLDAIKEIYGDDRATIDSELTADIIGEYLFTDYDFIHNLSTQNRNVFQKIYDEIKCMVKIATAGSKEARDLERVKKMFDKAWRENVKGKPDTKTETNAEPKTEAEVESEVNEQYSIRKEAPPTKTEKAYKLMRLVDGDLYPLFIGNNEKVSVGTWYNADSPNLSQLKDLPVGTHLVNMETGEAITWDEYAEQYLPKKNGQPVRSKPNKDDIHWANDNGYRFMHIEDKTGASANRMMKQYGDTRAYYNWGVNGSAKSDTGEGSASLYALRPGWHFGEVPSMHQIGYGENKDVRLDNQVWVEVDMSADVDYNEEAASNWGGDIPTHIPTDGYYKFATNPTQKKTKSGTSDADNTKADWYVAGAFKVNRILSDTEADAIVNQYNQRTGRNVPLDHRRSGNRVFNAETMSVEDSPVKSLEGGSVTKYSLSTWTPEMQKKVSQNLVSAGFAENDVEKWIADTNGIAAVIASDKARLDFEAHENHTMVKDNNEYYKTVEASTLCAKRLKYQGTFDAIQHRLPNTTLTSDMLIELREMMKKNGHEVPCGACYVESRRRHLGKYATDWLKTYDGEYIPTLADVTTTNGLEKLRIEHPQTYDDFIAAMNKKGVSNPKVVELRTEYKGEIMKIPNSTYKKIMKIGGLRLQSFSDFETPHLLDMMQVVHDMASRKFVSQAYTKVPNFAWVLGDTNIKINLSLIPSGTGVDANGELTFDPKEGMDVNEAMRLRDRYSKNVGTTIIGINDEHILKCMADDRIDYIIPFHRSGWGSTELKAMGLDSYIDYTKQQRERDIETGKGVDNIDEMSYWDFSKTGKENAETYLAICAEKGVIPKFDKFLVNNGDGSYSLQPDGSTDGYWKTLINFKMYDNDGVGSPHQAVVPNFNMEEAHRVLNEYEGGANSLPVANDVVEEFVKKYQENIAPVKPATQYSMTKDTKQQSYHDYLDAVNSGDTDTAQKLLDGFAKDAGYNYRGVHRSFANFTVFDREKIGSNAGTRLGDGFYVTLEFKDDATAKYADSAYGENRMDLYVKMESPLVLGTPLDESIVNKMEEDFSEFGWFGEDSTSYYAVTPEKIKKVFQSSDGYEQMETIRLIADRNGMKISELLNQYGFDSVIDENDYVKQAVVFDETQLKSAEPVTYDEYGDVIMPYERFNQDNVDIRYSISKGNRNTSGDWHIDGKDFGYTDEFEDFAPIRDDINTANTDSNAETVLPNTEPVLEEEKPQPKPHLGKDKPKKEKPNDEKTPAQHRREKSKGYTDFWANLIGDTSTWVDLPTGLAYKTRTLRRILRKVVRDANGKPDIKKADAIYDALETKYDHNEALLKRESARLKDVFQKLKLNHAEDQYAQMLGELRHNPETTLTPDVVKEFLGLHKNQINEQKVNKAIEESRKLYDDLLVRVNEVLREQGFKEIPYRKGYFPHFTNPKQNWLQKALNWKPTNDEIPTSIAGLTEMFKPSRSWQSFNKQRMGDKTDYSLYQGLDTYIHGALDWFYHIEDLQERRSLENLIRYTHSEEGVKQKIDEILKGNYDADEAQSMIDAVLAEANNPLGGLVRELMNRTNTLANKKSSMDRAVEDLTSRKVYSVMTNLNNRITANQVVGSFSSALTNFIPMVQSWHQVSPWYTARGMGDYIRSVVKDDGMVEKSDFLTNRLMEEEKLYQTGWDKVSDKAGFMMSVVDSITSNTVWRSKYLQNLSEGMSETQAIKDADQFAKNLMGGRSRGNAPTIFDAKNPLVKMFTAFQLEVANQYGYMFDDVIKDSKSKTRLVKGYATAFLGAYAYNALYSSLVGRDAAFDPISIIEELLSGLFDDEEEKKDVLMDFGTNILEEVPFVGGMLGGGRVPISSAFPYSGYSNPVESALTDISEGKFSKEWLKPLWYLAMPVGGGQVKKTIEGLSMFSDDHPVTGSYTDSGNLRFPVEDTFGNRVQAALFGQYASKNARDYFDNNRSALKPDQIQEYMDLDAPIQDYWEYRDGLKGLDSVGEKADYINSLDFPIDKKNLLINNQTDRKTPIDLTGYDEYDDFEEFDWATKNPEKYEFFSELGVSYKDYKNANEEKKKDYNWAYDYPQYVTLSKVATDDVWEYREWYKDMVAFKADKDKNGKSISGSKKRKVIDYINSLDIEYGAKLVLMKSQYEPIDDYNEEIFEYIRDKRDLTFEEKLSILKTLGYGVSDDGNVTWD